MLKPYVYAVRNTNWLCNCSWRPMQFTALSYQEINLWLRNDFAETLLKIGLPNPNQEFTAGKPRESITWGSCKWICHEVYMNAETLNWFLESQGVWIAFLIILFFTVCLLEELFYQHNHPLCLVCIVDGLLYQKLYDPLFFVIEEYIYIPMCLIAEDLYVCLRDCLAYILPVVRINERWLHCYLVQCKSPYPPRLILFSSYTA